MKINKILAEKLYLEKGYLYDFEYSEEDEQYPTVYLLIFRFHNIVYKAYFLHKRLFEEKDCSLMRLTGPTDLFASLDKRIRNGEFTEAIKTACEQIWNFEKD